MEEGGSYLWAPALYYDLAVKKKKVKIHLVNLKCFDHLMYVLRTNANNYSLAHFSPFEGNPRANDMKAKLACFCKPTHALNNYMVKFNILLTKLTWYSL